MGGSTVVVDRIKHTDSLEIWHLKDSLNAVNKHCLMDHSPPVGSILVGKCDASA